MPQEGPEEGGRMSADLAKKAERSPQAKDASVEAAGRSGLERERQIGIEQDPTNAKSAEKEHETLRGKRRGGV